MSLHRAEIEIIAADANGFQSSGQPETRFSVQFNPQTLRFSKGSQIAEIAVYGLDAPLLQYVRGQAETLTVELFFDSTETGMGEGVAGVGRRTDQFYQLVKQQSELHAPPRVTFSWGAGFSFTGVVERLERTFELFAPDGTPLRATLTLTLKEYRPLDQQIATIKPSSPDKTRQVFVRDGDTIHGIALAFLGDPRFWRLIAEANGIDDPLNPPIGMPLIVPPLPPSAVRGRPR